MLRDVNIVAVIMQIDKMTRDDARCKCRGSDHANQLNDIEIIRDVNIVRVRIDGMI
jgi:hypothetical protein